MQNDRGSPQATPSLNAKHNKCMDDDDIMAKNDPDNEAEQTGVAIEVGGAGEDDCSNEKEDQAVGVRRQGSQVSLDYRMPASTSTKPAAATKPTPTQISGQGRSEGDSHQRKTAGFWISKLDLATILEGDSCGKSARWARELLAAGTLDATQTRRLRAHMGLRDAAMRLWPGSICKRRISEIHEDLDMLIASGTVIPVTTRMHVLRASAGVHWKSLTDDVFETSRCAKAIDQLLLMYQPWGSESQTEFDHKEPRLHLVGLDDQSVGQALQYEIVATYLVPWIESCDKDSKDLIQLFAERMVLKWQMPEDAEVGMHTFAKFIELRQFCRVATLLHNPVFTQATDMRVFDDFEKMVQASGQTSKEPTILSMVGQSWSGSSAHNVLWAKIAKALPAMKAKGAIIVKSWHKLDEMLKPDMATETFQHFVKGLLEDIPAYSSLLAPGFLDEYEAYLVNATTDSVKAILATADSNQKENRHQVLTSAAAALKVLTTTSPTNEEVRRLSRDVGQALSQASMTKTVDEVIAHMTKCTAGEEDLGPSILGTLHRTKQGERTGNLQTRVSDLAEHVGGQLMECDIKGNALSARADFLAKLVQWVDPVKTQSITKLAEAMKCAISMNRFAGFLPPDLAAIEEHVLTSIATQRNAAELQRSLKQMRCLLPKLKDTSYKLVPLLQSAFDTMQKTMTDLAVALQKNAFDKVSTSVDENEKLCNENAHVVALEEGVSKLGAFAVTSEFVDIAKTGLLSLGHADFLKRAVKIDEDSALAFLAVCRRGDCRNIVKLYFLST